MIYGPFNTYSLHLINMMNVCLSTGPLPPVTELSIPCLDPLFIIIVCIYSHSQKNTHLNVPVGQQQVHDYIRGEQLHTVEALLDAAQLLAQVFTAETLPGHPDLMSD